PALSRPANTKARTRVSKKAMNTDSRQMRFCSSSILCTERNSATTKNIAGITGKSVNQGGTDRVVISPSDCTANSVSAAHSAQRNTGRVNRECHAQVVVLITTLSVQYTCHSVKYILHRKTNFPLVFVTTRPIKKQDA